MITSPIRGVEYQLRSERMTHEIWPLTASAAAEVCKIFWFINDAFVGDMLPGNALAWKPGRSGKYLVRAVDDQGRADVRELNVGIRKELERRPLVIANAYAYGCCYGNPAPKVIRDYVRAIMPKKFASVF